MQHYFIPRGPGMSAAAREIEGQAARSACPLCGAAGPHTVVVSRPRTRTDWVAFGVLLVLGGVGLLNPRLWKLRSQHLQAHCGSCRGIFESGLLSFEPALRLRRLRRSWLARRLMPPTSVYDPTGTLG